jgi:AraC-like DNA-binding protein
LWLTAMILFEDVEISLPRFAPAVTLALFSLMSRFAGPNGGVFGALATALNLALAGHVFVRVAQGWRGDLVEKRRRLRRPLLVTLALLLAFVLFIQGVVVAGVAGIVDLATKDLTNALLDVAIAAAAVAAGALALEPRTALLAEPLARPARKEEVAADDAALARLEALMSRDEIWRREGLTVGGLAAALGLPEHRVRVLINSRLGHRNFAAFINARRIDTARHQLSDPAFAQTPVSTIAYDLGFASLGPFNRAFKDALGVTPTEWRRSHQPMTSR